MVQPDHGPKADHEEPAETESQRSAINHRSRALLVCDKWVLGPVGENRNASPGRIPVGRTIHIIPEEHILETPRNAGSHAKE